MSSKIACQIVPLMFVVILLAALAPIPPASAKPKSTGPTQDQCTNMYAACKEQCRRTQIDLDNQIQNCIKNCRTDIGVLCGWPTEEGRVLQQIPHGGFQTAPQGVAPGSPTLQNPRTQGPVLRRGVEGVNEIATPPEKEEKNQ